MKVLVILGGGGHTTQMLRLVNMLDNNFDYDYVIIKDDLLSVKKIKIPGQIYYMRRTRKINEKLTIAIFKQFFGCFEALKILLKSKPAAIISCGPNIAAPICFLGKLLGKKIIFLESWSRIYRKSNTGRFIYYFADLFFVQWPEMLKHYPKAIYAGRLA